MFSLLDNSVLLHRKYCMLFPGMNILSQLNISAQLSNVVGIAVSVISTVGKIAANDGFIGLSNGMYPLKITLTINAVCPRPNVKVN